MDLIGTLLATLPKTGKGGLIIDRLENGFQLELAMEDVSKILALEATEISPGQYRIAYEIR